MNLLSSVSLILALGGIENCTFASLTYCAKDSGELARHNVLLGFNYKTCVEKSLLELEILRPSLSGIDGIAADELLASFTATLNGTQTGYTKAATYADTAIKGLKVNTVDDTLQLFGLRQSKVVLREGIFKVVKSAPKTIAKNKLRKALPIGKFKEFALDAGHFSGLRVNGNVLEFA